MNVQSRFRAPWDFGYMGASRKRIGINPSDVAASRIVRGLRPIVLVVESNDVARDVIANILAIEGYRVAQASNGQVALDALRGGLMPALIVLDLMMPVMNGWEFRCEQAAVPVLAEIPTIVMVGAGETPLDPGVLSAAGLLRKPISSDALLAAAARLTRG